MMPRGITADVLRGFDPWSRVSWRRAGRRHLFALGLPWAPPLHKLTSEDLERVSGWFARKGVTPYRLPVAIADIAHPCPDPRLVGDVGALNRLPPGFIASDVAISEDFEKGRTLFGFAAAWGVRLGLVRVAA